MALDANKKVCVLIKRLSKQESVLHKKTLNKIT